MATRLAKGIGALLQTGSWERREVPASLNSLAVPPPDKRAAC